MRVATPGPTVLILGVLTGSVLGNLISNGDFELGRTGFTTQYACTADLTSSGTVVVGSDPRDYHPLAASYGDHTRGTGQMLIANGSVDGNASVWEQTVSVKPNTEYAFFYWLSAWTAAEIKQAQIRCLIDDVRAGSSGFTPTAAGEWGLVFFRWKSGAASPVTIRLVDRTGTIENNDFALDDIGMIEVGDGRVLVTASTRGGCVESPGEGAFVYPAGESVCLEAKGDPGYEFTGWAGDLADSTPIVWLDMDTDYLAEAEFRELDGDVTLRASGAAPNEFSTCADSVDTLTVLRRARALSYANGLFLGERTGVCQATYRFPIFPPPAGVAGPARVAVHVYGRTVSAGAVVRIGDTAPYWPLRGDLHKTFTGPALAALLEVTEEPVYWLTVQADAAMGAWDVAGVYVCYDCPGVPKSLLGRFHDHFSICQALVAYAGDPGIRALYEMKGDSQSAWEAAGRTVAFAEDLAGPGSALQDTVAANLAGLDGLLASWPPLTGSPDLTPLAGCHPQAILAGLDEAVASGRAYIAAYADAIADGHVTPDEASDLDRRSAAWKSDLEAWQATLYEVFGQLGDVYRQAQAAQEKPLRDAAERMIRAMTPWLSGAPDVSGLWVPSDPSYLEAVIGELQDFPAER
jgi:hypothetical protein